VLDLSFNRGYAFGETGLDADNTSAHDHHFNMQYKECNNPNNCNWHFWSDNLDPSLGNNNGSDGISGWEWSRNSSNDYNIVACSSPPTC
jgi:hypothetical protein